jgi:hypothetical protein
MSPSQFANVEFTSKLLTYPESLSVIFNLNSPGVMPLPDTLSSLTHNRTVPTNSSFRVLGSPAMTCNFTLNSDTYDVFTSTVIPNKYKKTYNVLGIQIPIRKRETNASECAQTTQHFTVYVLDFNDKIVYSDTRKEQVKTCDNQPTGWTNAHASYPRPDWSLVNIRFNKTIVLAYQADKFYRFKVLLHDIANYPKSLGTGDFRYTNTNRMQFMGISGYYWLFGKHQFVYSMITENSP